MKPKALLIDLDGVLRRWAESDASVEAPYGLPVGSIRKVAFSPQLLVPAITGEVSDRQWRTQAANQLSNAFPESRATQAVAKWSEDPGTVDLAVLSLLEKCRPSLRLVLVTNATSRLSSDLAMLRLMERFHSVVNSSEVGVAKPSPRIFEAALRHAEVAPNEALFVDDSAANVEAASALGMLSHQFTTHMKLESFLLQAGALNEATAP